MCSDPCPQEPNRKATAAPSSPPFGAGKTTVVRHLMSNPRLALGFSVSATTRAPRAGKPTATTTFLTVEEFASRLADQAFVEHEEVYEGLSYGTLCSEVERLRGGQDALFDVDVVGGQTLKSVFGDSALSIFVMPPSIEALGRGARTWHRRRNKRAEAPRPRAGSCPGFDVHW